MDVFSPSFLEMTIFLDVPLFVEMVFPEWVFDWVGSVRSLAVETFEWVRAWLALLCFKSRWVDFRVSFATPSKLPMIIREMRTIALSTFWSLNSTNSSRMTPLPTILALRYTRVYISTSNHNDNVSNVKLPVDNFLGIVAILVVPDVNLNYCHIWLR